MNKAYDPNYARSPEHRHQARRRALKKTALVLLILGLICLGISLLALVVGLFRHSLQSRFFMFSAVYGVAGAVLLAFYGLFHLIRALRHRQRRKTAQRILARVPVGDASGMVLILVLVVLGLVAGLVLQVQLTSRGYLRREQAAQQRQSLLQAAADAVRESLRELAADQGNSIDYPRESWAQPREQKTPDGIVTLVKIVDENRFFDLNNLTWYPTNTAVRLPSDIFSDLMTLCGDFTPMDKTDALIDWMDAGEQGAWESRHYRSLQPPYPAANRILYGWKEVLLINGFSRDFFAPRERGSTSETFQGTPGACMTLIPRSRNEPIPVNINTAGRETLLGVLGLEQEELVRTLLGLREITPIRSVDQMLAAVDPVLLDRARPYLDVRSRYFRIEARAYQEGQAVNLYAMAERNNDGNIEIVEWYY